MSAEFSPHQLKVVPNDAPADLGCLAGIVLTLERHGIPRGTGRRRLADACPSHTNFLKKEKTFAGFRRPLVGHFRNIGQVMAFERSERIIHEQRLRRLCPEL